MHEDDNDNEVGEQKRKTNEERETDKKAGMHMKDLGSDYNAFSAH